MLAGVWFAWPWFAFNSFAVGSPTRRAELAWLAAGLFVPAGVGMALLMAREAGWLPQLSPPYVGVVVIVLKLVVVYAVFLLQSRTIEIYEYYGGKLVNGVWPLLAALYLGDRWRERHESKKRGGAGEAMQGHGAASWVCNVARAGRRGHPSARNFA